MMALYGSYMEQVAALRGLESNNFPSQPKKENMNELQIFATVLISVCGGVVAISGAVAAVSKFWRYAHKKSDENSATLADVMECLAKDKRRIEDLEQAQAEADKQNKLILKAVVSLMSHELDGNHTAQLTKTRDEIQAYLIEK